MKKCFLLGWLLLSVVTVAVDTMAGDNASPQILLKRGPYGFFPVRLILETKADELSLRLTNMVPGVSYLVMIRTNRPHSTWLPFLSVINLGNTNAASFRINLKTHKSEEAVLVGGRNPGWTEHSIMEAARDVPAGMLPQMQFTAGSGEDADGDGLPDLYEDLVTRTDPLVADTGQTGMPDGYKDLTGDGWCNLQALNNGTDPLHWNQPPAPSNVLWTHIDGRSTLVWRFNASTEPGSFTVFHKAASAPGTTWQIAAQVKPVRDKYQLYEYIETNTNRLRSDVYSIRANYPTPAAWTVPARPDKDGIWKTVRQVNNLPTPKGYDLTVANTVPHARYLMLVRDGVNGFWKASGFFTGGTNGNPVKLEADKQGMLTTQGPFLLSKVQYAPTLEHAEFIAGSGEDADGDGLPDIYEVLVTKTDPDKSDTGSTGVLDGYKDLSGDGWTALEKFRRRANPLARDLPPAPIELTKPTLMDVMDDLWLLGQSDFKYEVTLEVRSLNPKSDYQPLLQRLEILFPQMQPDAVATNLQVRITTQLPEQKAPPRHSGGP